MSNSTINPKTTAHSERTIKAETIAKIETPTNIGTSKYTETPTKKNPETSKKKYRQTPTKKNTQTSINEETTSYEGTNVNRNLHLSSSQPQKIRFRGQVKDEFLIEVRKRVNNYLVKTGQSQYASLLLHLKSVAFFSLFGLLYCTLMFGWFAFIPRIFIWMAFGLSQALIATNIGHDALHGSYSSSPLINKILGFISYDCLGFSSYIWKYSHNQEHHTYTNISGVDPDISKPGILRLSPYDPYNKMQKFQQYYVWILYALVGTNWIFYSDYTYFWKLRKEIPLREKIIFLVCKALNLFVIYIAPFLFFPMSFWQTMFGVVAMQLIGGLAIAIVFQLAHVVENVEFPLPDTEGVITRCWSAHEMATTSNFGTDNFVLTHLVGGLNFQVEHHLFPKISHSHYFEISKIVKQTAKDFGYPYHEQPSLFAAVRSHYRLLRKFGEKEAI